MVLVDEDAVCDIQQPRSGIGSRREGIEGTKCPQHRVLREVSGAIGVARVPAHGPPLQAGR
jgi:hypothetical protein